MCWQQFGWTMPASAAAASPISNGPPATGALLLLAHAGAALGLAWAMRLQGMGGSCQLRCAATVVNCNSAATCALTHCFCRQGSGPAALREPGPGQAISDTNVTWGSEGDINRTLTAEQQAAQAANCSGVAAVRRMPAGVCKGSQLVAASSNLKVRAAELSLTTAHCPSSCPTALQPWRRGRCRR